MTKIGILTFHRSINYGAFMQSFSLSSELSKRFPNSTIEIIDYNSKIMEDLYNNMKWGKSELIHPSAIIKKKKQKLLFEESLKKLPLSQKKECSDGDTERVLKLYENDYDIFIVGSDAVWNWVRRGFPNPYIFHFEKDVIKMSYAASAFGMGKEFVKEEESLYWNKSLETFNFIGVRDNYTEELVKDIYPEAKINYTCDPTCFLNLESVYNVLHMDSETFKSYILKKYRIPKNKKLIGVMGIPKELMKTLKKRYGSEYLFVGLYNYTRYADVQMIDLNPFEWAVVFKMFEITITSFFHGTLLSLRNYVPVINYDLSDFSKKNEGKIHDVMRRMDLLECHFNELSQDKIIEQIDKVIKNRTNYSVKIAENIQKLSKTSEVFFERVGENI